VGFDSLLSDEQRAKTTLEVSGSTSLLIM